MVASLAPVLPKKVTVELVHVVGCARVSSRSGSFGRCCVGYGVDSPEGGRRGGILDVGSTQRKALRVGFRLPSDIWIPSWVAVIVVLVVAPSGVAAGLAVTLHDDGDGISPATVETVSTPAQSTNGAC